MDEELSLLPGVRDFYFLLTMPIAAYWLSATIFHLFDSRRWFQNYKIHAYEAGQARNRATLSQVFRQVLAQQLIQVAFSLAIDRALNASSASDIEATNGNISSGTPRNTTVWNRQAQADISSSHDSFHSDASPVKFAAFPSASARLALQLTVAIVIADFWQYGWHRIFHSNRFLYKYIHSVHHRIYVPYSYGALYSSLIEAFVVDTIGTTVTLYFSGLPTVPAAWFASLSIIKSVNDHSGYRFPYNPFNYISTNTTDFHDIHHQNWGMKYNYSQVYLTIWDDLLGTTMPAKEVKARRDRVIDRENPGLDAAFSSKKTE